MSTSVWPSIAADQLKKEEDASTVRIPLALKLLSSYQLISTGARALMAPRITPRNARGIEVRVGGLLCFTGAYRTWVYTGDE
jgi:hypothetical protein